MLRLKFWTVLTILWLCAFFTIERVHEPINIASFVYVLTALVAVVMLALPRLSEGGQLTATLLSWAALLAMKPALGYPVLGTHLPITLTEAMALGLTVALVSRVQASLSEFRSTALRISSIPLLDEELSFDNEQQNINRELHRARKYHRPFSLLALAPSAHKRNEVLDSLVREVQEQSAIHFLRSRVAQLVLDASDGCATVTLRGNHFVVSLPEADGEGAHDLLNLVRQTARDQLGIELQAGLASFPDQEITFHGLVERAESMMVSEQQSQSRAVDRSAGGADIEMRPFDPLNASDDHLVTPARG